VPRNIAMLSAYRQYGQDRYFIGASTVCWNLDIEKPKKLSKFRLKFSKSIRRKNGMVLKACSLIKRPPTGQVGLSAKRSPGLRLLLFCFYFIFIFGWGWGGDPTPAGWAQVVPALAGNKILETTRVWSLAPDAIRRVVWACACL
jgi:hypothetical protein